MKQVLIQILYGNKSIAETLKWSIDFAAEKISAVKLQKTMN